MLEDFADFLLYLQQKSCEDGLNMVFMKMLSSNNPIKTKRK